jgi:hypothetical protein
MDKAKRDQAMTGAILLVDSGCSRFQFGEG